MKQNKNWRDLNFFRIFFYIKNKMHDRNSIYKKSIVYTTKKFFFIFLAQ